MWARESEVIENGEGDLHAGPCLSASCRKGVPSTPRSGDLVPVRGAPVNRSTAADEETGPAWGSPPGRAAEPPPGPRGSWFRDVPAQSPAVPAMRQPRAPTPRAAGRTRSRRPSPRPTPPRPPPRPPHSPPPPHEFFFFDHALEKPRVQAKAVTRSRAIVGNE